MKEQQLVEGNGSLKPGKRVTFETKGPLSQTHYKFATTIWHKILKYGLIIS